jgi:ABC-type uncharacterized transport system substrate-binding protein
MKYFKNLWIAFIFSPVLLFAHPHIFVKASSKIVSDTKGIIGIEMVWNWDEMWSEDIIAQCDLDGNGIFNAKEMKLVSKNYFDSLKSDNYFTKIFADKKRVKTKGASKLLVQIKGAFVEFKFLIPVESQVLKYSVLEICLEDETMYTAFEEGDGIYKPQGKKKVSTEEYGDTGLKIIIK